MLRSVTTESKKMTPILIQNVRPLGAEPVDMLIQDGKIVQIAAGLQVDGAQIENGDGAIALPGLIEAHTHLDKTLWAMGWRPHQAGPGLMDRRLSSKR